MAGMYIHIPFCKQKCSYCDFHFSTSQSYVVEMVDAIVKETELRKNELSSPLSSIYFGGGTPSLLSIYLLEKIFNAILNHYEIKSDAEITLEINPDDCSLTYLRDLKSLGVNRVSLGIQSIHQDDLKFMNRAHDSLQALNALEMVANQNFQSFTIDLIFGIPSSNEKKWQQNLELVHLFSVPHISTYALTVEPRTLLWHQVNSKKVTMDEEMTLSQYHQLCNFLSQSGYDHYELSNFAKQGHISKHNSSYWKGLPYIGIGPSAHSYNGANIRKRNISNNYKYIKSMKSYVLPEEIEELSEVDRYNEFVMVSLRTKEGILMKDIQKFSAHIQHHFYSVLKAQKLQNTIVQNDIRITISEDLWMISDHIISSFFLTA